MTTMKPLAIVLVLSAAMLPFWFSLGALFLAVLIISRKEVNPTEKEAEEVR
jgi:hypothetical protein